MKYKIEFSEQAESDADKLFYSDKKLLSRIINKIESLTDEPRAGKPLVGNHKGEYSLRVGTYRIVYRLAISEHKIFILSMKHRKNVYL
ncbi:MAG: type II toxin-antitoxin system RelE/ParE family toxin [Deltaproteobacteria bacterium HGW-Deltaproteobacteria-10]|nr:MAG: type II toxin-antitoxin system RelE/ParE family toxin [Deltaproteobacteria bacterium HGW-Deltaproteobacteria-10]